MTLRMRRTILLVVMLLISIWSAAGCSARSARLKSPDRPDGERARAANEQAFELIEQGKYEQAEKLLKDAIAADVMFGPARNNLGLVYYHTNRLYQAAWEFQNAIKLMPFRTCGVDSGTASPR